ncbi:MAG TPA: BrnT family toxin [Thermodesulfovibrionales bacterium]|nr:BrnT family toxin [Thermodesulfovibrionales bacterium]
MNFKWDLKKAKANEQKHKITFLEACYVFADKCLLTLLDEEHSSKEERWITIGQSDSGKILVVVHTYRKAKGTETIRIISARKATKNEEKQYCERRG